MSATVYPPKRRNVPEGLTISKSSFTAQFVREVLTARRLVFQFGTSASSPSFPLAFRFLLFLLMGLSIAVMAVTVTVVTVDWPYTLVLRRHI